MLKWAAHKTLGGEVAYKDLRDFLKKLEKLAFFVIEHRTGIVGFGLIKPVLPFPAFMATGMLTYFILPEFTGKGLGNRLLERLTVEAKKIGMT